MATVYTMASQDLISQFSQESRDIPAAQSDRSRTPRRPHHDWHPGVPTFRGPMHYAMATPRPFWHPTGAPPPPPLTSSFSNTPHVDSDNTTFPTYTSTLSTTTSGQCNLTPQRHNLTPRSPRPMSSPMGTSPIQEGYTCRPIEIPPVEHWKPDVDFHDSNKVNGLDFPSKIRQSRFSSYKDIEGMDPLQVPLWKSYIKDYTIHGSAVSPTAEKPSFSHLTTSAPQYLLLNWSHNYAHETWTWTSWLLFKSRSAGQFVNQKEATQNMAKRGCRLNYFNLWLPAQPSADNASQQHS